MLFRLCLMALGAGPPGGGWERPGASGHFSRDCAGKLWRQSGAPGNTWTRTSLHTPTCEEAQGTCTQTHARARECTKRHGDSSRSCAQLLHHCTRLLEPLLCLVSLVTPGPSAEPGLQPELEKGGSVADRFLGLTLLLYDQATGSICKALKDWAEGPGTF